MENNYIIYKYTSPSGKSYIGQTKNPNQRKISHKNAKNNCTYFCSAIKKYGYENFTFEILENSLTLEESNIKEEYYINYFNTLSPNGYNLQYGGKNKKVAECTKIKMSNSAKNRPKCSDETRNKLKLAHIGEKSYLFGKCGYEHPKFGVATKEDTKHKIGFANSGNKNGMFGKCGELHHNYGLKMSQCAKDKMSLAKLGTKQSEETKKRRSDTLSKIYYIIYPNGVEEIIINMKNFCITNGLSSGGMSKVAKKHKSQYKGFRCFYFD